MEEMKTKNEFKNFEVVSYIFDHHFLNSSGESITNNPNGVAHKRIMEEWETLEQKLTESIYVRVYKDRIDLMRAAIMGGAGTPYHDGLFFFDIAFPSDYPLNPPMVSFISKPDEVKRTMKLFNSENCEIWEENCETWDPSVSSCLQALLSLQKLILNEKPYFAAMFCRSNIRGDSSRGYNKQLYSLTCRLTLHLILRPPTDFKALVHGHFRDRAPAILNAMKEYVNGCVSVGCYGGRASSSFPVKVSPEFEQWAQGFYPLMLEAFTLCGASLDASFHSLGLPSGILMKLMKLIKS